MGRWTYRYRWLVIAFWVVVLAGVGVLAPRVGTVLTSGFGEQDTEARQAFQILEEEGILNEAVIILVLSHDSLTVQDPVYEARAQTVLSAVGGYPGVARVDSFFATGNPNLVSPDGRTTFAIAGLDIPLDDVLDEVPKIRDSIPDVELEVWVTGGSGDLFGHQRVHGPGPQACRNHHLPGGGVSPAAHLQDSGLGSRAHSHRGDGTRDHVGGYLLCWDS